MRWAERHKVKMGWGTDLVEGLDNRAHQLDDLIMRKQWFSSAELMVQATGSNGELVALSGKRNPYGKLGVVEEGAMADVLVGRSADVLPIPDSLGDIAEERVDRVVLSEKADGLFGEPPPGARCVADELMVRYAETDAQRVAYYGSYYTWFEVGRNELTRSVGLPYSQLEREGVFLPVSEAFCRHFAPLRACERFRLRTCVPHFTRVRITFVNHILSMNGRPVASGYTVHGCTGRDGRPRGLPPEVAERFALCEETHP